MTRLLFLVLGLLATAQAAGALDVSRIADDLPIGPADPARVEPPVAEAPIEAAPIRGAPSEPGLGGAASGRSAVTPVLASTDRRVDVGVDLSPYAWGAVGLGAVLAVGGALVGSWGRARRAEPVLSRAPPPVLIVAPPPRPVHAAPPPPPPPPRARPPKAPPVARRATLHRVLLLPPPPPVQWSLRESLAAGHVATSRGDLEAALAWFRRAQRLRPEVHVARLCEGLVLAELRRDEAAVEAFRVALMLEPTDGHAWLALARTQARRGRSHEAMGALESLLTDVPQASEAIAEDEAFASLRDHPRFLAIVGRL